MLAGQKLMSEMYLRQLELKYSTGSPFSKSKEQEQTLKNPRKNQKIQDIRLAFTCMVYGGFNDLIRLTASDKVFHDKEFQIAKIPKYDGCQNMFW